MNEADQIARYLDGRPTSPETIPCRCESSLCDHASELGERCERPADPRFVVDYIEHACTQCVANMGATGGQEYLALAASEPTAPTRVFKIAGAAGRWLREDDRIITGTIVVEGVASYIEAVFLAGELIDPDGERLFIVPNPPGLDDDEATEGEPVHGDDLPVPDEYARGDAPMPGDRW